MLTRYIDRFVGPNSPKYRYKFHKFTIFNGRSPNFYPTWHWPAFFFTHWWFLYRKMYLWAVIFFALEFVYLPGVMLLKHVACGVFAYYLYYRHILNKINYIEFDDTIPLSTEKADRAEYEGGVHRWVPVVMIIIWVLLLLAYFLVAVPSSTLAPTSIESINETICSIAGRRG